LYWNAVKALFLGLKIKPALQLIVLLIHTVYNFFL
jgi:hypothetical protein